MKKLLALLLVLLLTFSLAACGSNNDIPSGSKNTPGTSQTDDGFLNRDEYKGELWDVADSDITILNEGHDVAIIPAGLKKGIGTQSKAQIWITDPGSSLAGAYASLFEARYSEVKQADVDAFVDYVEKEIGVEAYEGGLSDIYTEYLITTDVLDITILHYLDRNNVNVSAYIRAGAENANGSGEASNTEVGEPWPESDITALVPTPAQGKVTLASIDETSAIIEVTWTYAEVLAYVQQLQDAGFGDDAVEKFEQLKTLKRTHNGVEVYLVYLDDTWTQINITKK